MKTLTIAPILLSFALMAHAEGEEGLAAALPKLVGRSAKELNEDHAELLSRFRDAAQPEIAQPNPWHVWHYTNPAMEDRYLLFSGQHIFMIPGTSSASVRLFSGTGEQLGFWHFSTGWRIDIRSAEFERHELLRAPTITISTSPVINGRDVAKQIFSIVDDNLYYVRAEDSDGELLRNVYLSPNHTLGGDVSERKKEQWMADLTSDSLVRRLASLTYIAGVHMDPNRPRKGVHSESVEAAKIAHEVRTDDAAKAAIEAYSESKVAWLRESAEQAGSPEIRSH